MTFTRHPLILTRSFCCLASVLSAAACSAAEAPAPSAVTNPPFHVVARAPAKSPVNFEAVFESTLMTPVKLEPKAWTDLSVMEAVPHGALVKKGDVLVKLDLDKLKEQIEDLERDQPVALLALELAVAELENLEQTTPAKLEAARRASRVANEDLAYFEKTGKAQKEKANVFSIKGAEQRLDGAREELRQLERMYKADDLVEETEEIILRRSKAAVEAAEYGLEAARLAVDFSQKTGLPREAETLKNARRDQEAALALAEVTVPRGLVKKRFDTDKLKRDQKKTEKRLADLKKDLEILASVRAPADGVVYYGACEAGKWTTAAALAKKLVPTGKLAVNEVVMTVVAPEKLQLRGVLQEADLANLKTGLEGLVSPVSMPDKKLPVRLEASPLVPLPGGGFEARLSILSGLNPRLMPGMNGKVALGESPKTDAVRVPKEAVFTEDGHSRVFVVKPNGASEPREVKTGATDGRMTEIQQGLAEGEKILLAKPK